MLHPYLLLGAGRFHGRASIPAYALVQHNGRWAINDAGTVRPDGYIVDDSGRLAASDGATSGYSIVINQSTGRYAALVP